MKEFIRNKIDQIRTDREEKAVEKRISQYLSSGKEPWSTGYEDYKYRTIGEYIQSGEVLDQFKNNQLSEGYGLGIDERIVEYPWAFSRLSGDSANLLDAGSVLNFRIFVDHPVIENKELTIYTFAPEKQHYPEKRISYVFGDLRSLPFKGGQFDEIISISTIEHIDMDNAIYGWNADNKSQDKPDKSYEYLVVVEEMLRVLKSGGQLLLTFPYGKFHNYGFFQQLDDEMVGRILSMMNTSGAAEVDYFKYTVEGWSFSSAEGCNDILSYNPHTGEGKGNDGAAHCRSVCCINFRKQ